MLKLPHLLLLLSAGVLLASCDNEIELLEEEPAVPVLYGVYDASEDVQELSLSKTFRFAENGGAREAAATPDSVYYPADAITIIATRTDSTAEVVAEQFNAAAEGTIREEGPFSVTDVLAYRFDVSPLQAKAGDSIRLRVLNGDQEIASVTQVQLPRLEFNTTRPPSNRFPLTSEQQSTYRWDIVERDERPLIRAVEIGFLFTFSEMRGDDTQERTLYWPAARDLTEQNATSAGVKLEGIFDFLKSRLEVDPSISRRFLDMQLVVTAGDQSFRDYRTLLDANRGITSTQELPPFSNIEGAVGLYGSITQLIQEPGNILTTGGYDALYGLDGDIYQVGPLNFAP